MVIAGDVSLADAAATALGNAIKDKNPGLIEGSMRRLMIDEIEGMIVVVDDIFGVCGNLPEIVKVQMDTEKICKG